MKQKNKTSFSLILCTIILAIIAIIWITPLIWAFLTSFKSEVEVQTVGFSFLPAQWVVTNYIDVLTDTGSAPVIRWFINSLIISISHTLLVLVVTSTSAYAYGRLKFKGKDIIFSILLASMMFPSVINLIPLFKIVDTFGWVNSFLALIIPGLGGVTNIYLIKQFMTGIPKEFDESARVDGANDWQIFSKIILPLIKPILIVVALFSFTGSWNDFLWPSIVINNIDKMPLTPGLKLIQGMYNIKIAHLMAAAIVSIIPTFVLYLAAQKYFLEGLSVSAGVKG